VYALIIAIMWSLARLFVGGTNRWVRGEGPSCLAPGARDPLPCQGPMHRVIAGPSVPDTKT
jgi:hypothetical protein